MREKKDCCISLNLTESELQETNILCEMLDVTRTEFFKNARINYMLNLPRGIINEMLSTLKSMDFEKMKEQEKAKQTYRQIEDAKSPDGLSWTYETRKRPY